MKIFFINFMLFLVLFGLSIDQIVKADFTSDSQQLMDLAEQNFSQSFNPPLNTQQSQPEWPFYRGPYNNNVYLGINADGFVYVVGSNFGRNLTRVGNVQEVLAMLQTNNSSCSGNSNLAMIWASLERGTILIPRQSIGPGFGWFSFIHPIYPLLGFLYPPNWTPFLFASGQDVGVDLVRNDNGAIYHNFSTVDPARHSPKEWENWSVNRAFNNASASGTPIVLCSLPTITREIAPGVLNSSTAAVFVTDDTIVLSYVSIITINGLFGNNVSIITLGGRINEFDRLADDVFFPIHFQLLIGRRPQLDSDGDGVSDMNDNAPFDSTRQ